MSKYILIAVLSLLLTACGSGGSDSSGSIDSTGNGSTGSGMTYVTGDFKTASIDSEYAPLDYGAYGLSNAACAGESYYFESANVVVYGMSSLPQDDFKYAATLVENKLNEAFNLMGISREEFDSYRPQYTPQVGSQIIGAISNGYIDPLDAGLIVPDNWESMVGIDQDSVIRSYWNDSSDSKQVELVNIYSEFFGINNATDGNMLPSKIGVCLDQGMNATLYGQGTLLGMNLAPNSIASRSDAGQVVLHELIHAIQINVSTPVNTSEQVSDVWFMEGQATYLSGQTVASSAGGHYPVDVVDSGDASNIFQGDDGLAYTHYAKAYSYLDTNSGKNRVMDLLKDVRFYKNGGNNTGYSGVSSDRFTEAFDVNMLKANNEQLTLEEFRQNYHSLIK